MFFGRQGVGLGDMRHGTWRLPRQAVPLIGDMRPNITSCVTERELLALETLSQLDEIDHDLAALGGQCAILGQIGDYSARGLT